MSETVHETDDPNAGPYGNAERARISVDLVPATAMYVTLPDVTDGGNRVPFVVYLGWTSSVMLHAERAELERLHALIGRALEQDAARNEDRS